jgi:hypothetical protein
MATRVKVLGALEIALGILGMFGAAIQLVVVGLGATIADGSGEPGAAGALPIVGLTGMALVTFLAVVSLAAIVIGVGLIRFRPWARIAAIVLSIPSLTIVPFGTIVGIYGLWVLFNGETKRLFAAPAAGG